VLTISTALGPIEVQLRPDIAPGVVADVTRIVEQQLCGGCNFYR